MGGGGGRPGRPAGPYPAACRSNGRPPRGRVAARSYPGRHQAAQGRQAPRGAAGRHLGRRMRRAAPERVQGRRIRGRDQVALARGDPRHGRAGGLSLSPLLPLPPLPPPPPSSSSSSPSLLFLLLPPSPYPGRPRGGRSAIRAAAVAGQSEASRGRISKSARPWLPLPPPLLQLWMRWPRAAPPRPAAPSHLAPFLPRSARAASSCRVGRGGGKRGGRQRAAARRAS